MRPFRHLPVFSFFVACLLLVVSAQAQVPDYIRAPLTGRGHALLIGVSHYGEDSGWTPLPSVSDDIAVLQNSLAPHFATVDTLLNPTTKVLSDKLREFLLGKWNRTDERLLVYYAGHGFTSFKSIFPRGYGIHYRSGYAGLYEWLGQCCIKCHFFPRILMRLTEKRKLSR